MLNEIVRAVRGRRLRGVRYLTLPGWFPDIDDANARGHEIDFAVELTFNDEEPVTVQWRMDDEHECLAISRETAEVSNSSCAELIDTSMRPPWPDIIGNELDAIGIARHTPDLANQECLWSVRFSFAKRRAFTVALGEFRDDVPRYLPDSLVVLFGQDEAVAYQISSSTDSSWGVELD